MRMTCSALGCVRTSNLCSTCITVVKTDTSVTASARVTRSLAQDPRSASNRFANLPTALTAAMATYNEHHNTVW